jgi:hypothetical protein
VSRSSTYAGLGRSPFVAFCFRLSFWSVKRSGYVCDGRVAQAGDFRYFYKLLIVIFQFAFRCVSHETILVSDLSASLQATTVYLYTGLSVTLARNGTIRPEYPNPLTS